MTLSQLKAHGQVPSIATVHTSSTRNMLLMKLNDGVIDLFDLADAASIPIISKVNGWGRKANTEKKLEGRL